MIIVNYVGWSGSGVVGSGLVLFLPEGRARAYFSNSSWQSSPGDGTKETMGVSLRLYYSVPEVCFQERKRYSWTYSDFDVLIWSRLHDRWGYPPSRVARSARLGNLHSQDQILPCKRYPPNRGRIRDTSNSPKIHFGCGFALLLHVTIESHITEGCSKWVLKSTYLPNRWFVSIFLVYVLSDHSIILTKCTPGWWGCKVACKGGVFFYPT